MKSLLGFTVAMSMIYFSSQAQPENKTTATISRLVAKAVAEQTTVFDSTTFTYSGDRSWNDKLKAWDFDLKDDFIRNSNGFRYYTRAIQSFNNAGQVSELKEQRYGLQSNWMDQQKTTYTYNASGNAVLIKTELARSNNNWEPQYEIAIVYDNANRVTDSTVARYMGGIYQPEYQMLVSYTTEGIATKSFSSWDGSNWATAINETYKYAGGRLAERIYKYMPSGPTYRYTYSYDANGQNNDLKIEIESGSDWHLTTKAEYTYDNNGNITLALYKDDPNYNGNLENYFREQMSYNSFNQLTKKTAEKYSNGQWVPPASSSGAPYQQFFYYEQFFNSGVGNAAQIDGQLKIYPIPGNDIINIDLKDIEPGQFSIAIYNTDGRTVRRWNQPVTGNEYEEAISIADLPVGNYILRAGNTKGQISRQFSIAR